MSHRSRVFAVVVVLGLMGVPSALGQQAADPQAPSEPATRAALIEQEEQAKFANLAPAAPGKAEAYVTRISDTLLAGNLHWHAFWQNAYSGGGFTLGAGYLTHVSAYNFLDGFCFCDRNRHRCYWSFGCLWSCCRCCGRGRGWSCCRCCGRSWGCCSATTAAAASAASS